MFCSTLWKLIGGENIEETLPILAVALFPDIDRSVVALNRDPNVTSHDALAPADTVIHLAPGKIEVERSAVGIAMVICIGDDPDALHSVRECLEHDDESCCSFAMMRRQIDVSEYDI